MSAPTLVLAPPPATPAGAGIVPRDVQEVLLGVLVLLRTPEAWLQEEQCLTAAGRPCDPRDRDAACWCLLGALRRVTQGAPGLLGPARRALEAELPEAWSHLVAWQDAPGREHREVLALVQRALRRQTAQVLWTEEVPRG